MIQVVVSAVCEPFEPLVHLSYRDIRRVTYGHIVGGLYTSREAPRSGLDPP
jgi:hypothetical protein